MYTIEQVNCNMPSQIFALGFLSISAHHRTKHPVKVILKAQSGTQTTFERIV
jgi:hypothetical protein